MKKVIALGVLVIALALPACSVSGASQPAADYISYENTEAGYKIQYPEKYIFVERGMLDSARSAALELMPEDMRTSVDMSAFQAVWQVPGTNSSITLMLSPASGITQETLKSPDTREGMEAEITEHLSGTYQDFSVTEHAAGKPLGSQYFIMYKGSYTLGGLEWSMCQAITVGGGSFYAFTLACADGRDALNRIVAQFEAMLSTLEFT